jgi:hypothetical protein
MTFNFQQDLITAQQQFQVSERWWYFLAATIPPTYLYLRYGSPGRDFAIEDFALEDVLSQQKLSSFDGSGGGIEWD